MDNFYTRCVLTPGRNPACHSCMAGSPRKCQVLQDQAVSLPLLLSASTLPPPVSPSDPEVCRGCLAPGAVLASVVRAHGGHTDWDPSGSILWVLMQRSPACLKVKQLGISAANGSLIYPKKRSARMKYPKWRLLWRAGEGLQCHTALAATVVVFFCERHKGYVEKTHKTQWLEMWYMLRTELENKPASVHCGHEQNSRNREGKYFWWHWIHAECSGLAGLGVLLDKQEPLGLSQTALATAVTKGYAKDILVLWVLAVLAELSMWWKGQDFRCTLFMWEELSSHGTCHVFSYITNVLKVHFVFL